LSWRGGVGNLELPDELDWAFHRGETHPPLGWYSRSFGKKVPTCTLVGTGRMSKGLQLVTRLQIVLDDERRLRT
jgi:hypothetical protein